MSDCEPEIPSQPSQVGNRSAGPEPVDTVLVVYDSTSEASRNREKSAGKVAEKVAHVATLAFGAIDTSKNDLPAELEKRLGGDPKKYDGVWVFPAQEDGKPAGLPKRCKRKAGTKEVSLPVFHRSPLVFRCVFRVLLCFSSLDKSAPFFVCFCFVAKLKLAASVRWRPGSRSRRQSASLPSRLHFRCVPETLKLYLRFQCAHRRLHVTHAKRSPASLVAIPITLTPPVRSQAGPYTDSCSGCRVMSNREASVSPNAQPPDWSVQFPLVSLRCRGESCTSCVVFVSSWPSCCLRLCLSIYLLFSLCYLLLHQHPFA